MAYRMVAAGGRYGKLTVISDAGHYQSPGGKLIKRWLCQCDCGGTATPSAQRLNSGATTSCGCVKRSVLGNATRKHGEAGKVDSAEYRIWCGMIDRCANPNNRDFHIYGGKGIRISDGWQGESGFQNFLSDMGRRPSSKHSIDRINSDSDYAPENCRWATPAEQARNTSRNIFIEYEGERLVVQDWAQRTGLNKQTIIDRLRRGWSGPQAIGKQDHPRAFTRGPIPRPSA